MKKTIISLISRKISSLNDIREFIERYFDKAVSWFYDASEESISYHVYETEGVYEQVIEIYLNNPCFEFDIAAHYAAQFSTQVVISIGTQNPYLWLMIYPNKFFVGCRESTEGDYDFIPLEDYTV